MLGLPLTLVASASHFRPTSDQGVEAAAFLEVLTNYNYSPLAQLSTRRCVSAARGLAHVQVSPRRTTPVSLLPLDQHLGPVPFCDHCLRLCACQ